MRQLAIICCLVGTFLLWGCGGHKKTPPTPPAKVTVDVTGLSLTFGEIFTLAGASVHLVDASGNILSTAPAFTVSSSNTNLVTINGSEICGGIFNGNATVCNAKDANGNLLTAGSATITVSAQGVNSDPIPVSVHQKVTSAQVVFDLSNGPAPGCRSQNDVQKFRLIACNAGSVSGNACTNGGSDISTSLGTITWSTSDSNIGSIAADGTVTSKLPGAVNVFATVGNVNAVSPTPGLFVACPPKTISIHVTGVTDTTFALDPTASTPVNSVKLDADVTDTAGKPITGVPLTWASFNPASATVGTDGTVTQAAPGTTSIVASCTPPSCNNAPGLSPQPIPAGTAAPVFSNLVTGSVAGASAPAIYATAPTTDGTLSGATANTTLLTIDPAHPDTPQSVTLPHPANSMVFDHTGSKAYLGTTDGHGIMQFDPNSPTTAPTVLGDGTITGTVIAVSRDGTRIVVSDTAAGKVFVYNTAPAAGASNVETYTVAGVSNADFALNSSNGFLASPAGGQLYTPGRIFPVSLGTDVKYLPQGSVAYFSGDPSMSKPFTGISTCNNATIESGSNSANVWGVAIDGSHLVGANATGWLDLTTSGLPAGPCPTAFTSNAKAVSFASPSFVGTPTQVVVTPDRKKVFMTGFTRPSTATASGIPFYDIAAGTANVVTTGIPADAQVFSGGITLDGTALYLGVGGSKPGIYKVDPVALTAAPLAVPASSLTFVPSIVAVRPK